MQSVSKENDGGELLDWLLASIVITVISGENCCGECNSCS